MFSVIIPTLNNLEYLKNCIYSIKKNSKYKHEIIIHVNVGNDGTISTKSIEGLNPYSSPYTFGTENELGGGLLFPPGGVKEGISLEPLTPEEQIAQYGKEQYGMAGPLPKGYYSGPADRVYKYGEGPFAAQTQQYLDNKHNNNK